MADTLHWVGHGRRDPQGRGGARSTTTSSCSAAPRRATRCSSTPPTSTSACSTCATPSASRRVLETHGHWDHIQAVPRAARRRLLGGRHRRGRRRCSDSYDDVLEDDSVIEVGRLRLSTRSSRRATRRARCASASRATRCCSAATPSSRAGRATPSSRAATSPRSSAPSSDRLFSPIPADTIVLPGHGDDTTIGAERPHLQEWIDRGW